jgi:hypothetical protein
MASVLMEIFIAVSDNGDIHALRFNYSNSRFEHIYTFLNSVPIIDFVDWNTADSLMVAHGTIHKGYISKVNRNLNLSVLMESSDFESASSIWSFHVGFKTIVVISFLNQTKLFEFQDDSLEDISEGFDVACNTETIAAYLMDDKIVFVQKHNLWTLNLISTHSHTYSHPDLLHVTCSSFLNDKIYVLLESHDMICLSRTDSGWLSEYSINLGPIDATCISSILNGDEIIVLVGTRQPSLVIYKEYNHSLHLLCIQNTFDIFKLADSVPNSILSTDLFVLVGLRNGKIMILDRYSLELKHVYNFCSMPLKLFQVNQDIVISGDCTWLVSVDEFGLMPQKLNRNVGLIFILMKLDYVSALVDGTMIAIEGSTLFICRISQEYSQLVTPIYGVILNLLTKRDQIELHMIQYQA